MREGSAIELEDASVQLAGRTVWSEVSISMARGEFVALLGANGSGKSTLLRVVLGALALHRGRVRVLGEQAGARNAAIGYLPQLRSFEPGTPDWTLNGAREVSGNEPFKVGGANDNHSLSIPSGASATSATICAGIGHPDIRFFASGSSATATLNVEVLFADANGNTQSAPIGAVTGSTGWAPTAPMLMLVNLLPVLPNDMTPVQFRFTASGGDFTIDDVYVDPFRC